jgi:hypothetical protein
MSEGKARACSYAAHTIDSCPFIFSGARALETTCEVPGRNQAVRYSGARPKVMPYLFDPFAGIDPVLFLRFLGWNYSHAIPIIRDKVRVPGGHVHRELGYKRFLG